MVEFKMIKILVWKNLSKSGFTYPIKVEDQQNIMLVKVLWK
jgi:hypothetical protein